MQLKTLALALALAAAAFAQNGPQGTTLSGGACVSGGGSGGPVQVTSAPAGSCITGVAPQQVISTGALYYCQGASLSITGTWTQVATGTNNPSGSTGYIQYANGGAFGSNSALNWNTTANGLNLNVTNPNAQNNSTDADGLYANCTYSTDTVSTPGFTDQNCFELHLNANMGQGNYGPNPNYESKKSFIGLLMQNSYPGSGQKFGITRGITCLSMSDCAADQMTVEYAGGPIGGDENQGFTTQSYLTQTTGQLTVPTVASASPTRSACNTWITSSTVKSNVAQAFSVNSTAGCNLNDWIVLAQEPPSAGPSEQAMQITCTGGSHIGGDTSGCTTGQLGGIVKNIYQVVSLTTGITSGGTGAVLSAASTNVLPGQLVLGTGIAAGTYMAGYGFSQTGTFTNGSPNITNVADVSGLVAGQSQKISAAGFLNPGTTYTVSSITGSAGNYTVVMSANATASGSTPVGFAACYTSTACSGSNSQIITLTSAATATNASASLTYNFTVTPATVITTSSSSNFGQDRYLVDTTAGVARSGNVSAVSGGGFTNALTDWSYAMVGGQWPLAGCVNINADTYAGGWGGPGGGGFSGSGQSGPLHSWYAIASVASSSQIGILSNSTAGDASYHGNGSIATQGSTTNTSQTLNITGGLWWQTFNGEYVSSNNGDIPAGTTILSGGGTNTLTLSNAATASNTLDQITIQGGPYTISPCARVLTWSGTTVILETNSFAWTQNDQLELAVVPYPDSEGFQYNMSLYTPGGADHDYTGSQGRAFLHLNNRGAREIANGIVISGPMNLGGNSDKTAYGTGMWISGATNRGIVLGEVQSGQAVNVWATSTTGNSSHPCYAANTGSQWYSGVCWDSGTGQWTIEQQHPNIGTNPANVSWTVTTIPGKGYLPTNGVPQYTATVATNVVNVNQTALSSTTGATTWAGPPSSNGADQQYQMCYYLDTTTAGSAGTALVELIWTDNSGVAHTLDSPTIALNALGSYQQACVPILVAAGKSASYNAKVSGNSGGQFEFHLNIQRMIM